MIYKHIRTGGLYRKLFESYSVERQKPSVVYLQLETGDIFDRDAEMFGQNFEFVKESQHIVPKK